MQSSRSLPAPGLDASGNSGVSFYYSEITQMAGRPAIACVRGGLRPKKARRSWHRSLQRDRAERPWLDRLPVKFDRPAGPLHALRLGKTLGLAHMADDVRGRESPVLRHQRVDEQVAAACSIGGMVVSELAPQRTARGSIARKRMPAAAHQRPSEEARVRCTSKSRHGYRQKCPLGDQKPTSAKAVPMPCSGEVRHRCMLFLGNQ